MSCGKSQPADGFLFIDINLAFGTDWSNKMEDKPRPYLNAALLCEKVLQEKDGSQCHTHSR